jgi:hypothetical protein
MVDENELEEIKIPIYVVGTGQPFDFRKMEVGTDYISIIQMGSFVWHILTPKRDYRNA